MSRRIGLTVAAALTAVVVLVGCSDEPSSWPSGQADDQSPSVPPQTSDGAREPALDDDVTGLRLDLGEWADDERSRSLERYLAAVGETVRAKVTSPLFFDSTSAQQMDDRRAHAARAKDQGATVAETTVAYLAELDQQADTAVAQVCLWGPSVAFVDERTGEPLKPMPPRWTPRSVTMTFVQQQWLVVDEARGRHACDEEAP